MRSWNQLRHSLPEILQLLLPLAPTLEKLCLNGNETGGTISNDIAAFERLGTLELAAMQLSTENGQFVSDVALHALCKLLHLDLRDNPSLRPRSSTSDLDYLVLKCCLTNHSFHSFTTASRGRSDVPALSSYTTVGRRSGAHFLSASFFRHGETNCIVRKRVLEAGRSICTRCDALAQNLLLRNQTLLVPAPPESPPFPPRAS